MNQILHVISKNYGADFAKSFVQNIDTIEHSYVCEQWKLCGLEAGHFVEYSRRIIEFELFKIPIDLNIQLSKFNDSILKKYEQASGDESFRIIIPRVLFSIYTLRNKRGIAHTANTMANKLDSSLIITFVKWVISELIRLKSTDTFLLIAESILQKNISLIWKNNISKRILNPKLSARDQVLLLLYQRNSYKVEELQEMIEYRNLTNFKKIIKNKLHKERLIEFDSISNQCYLSPIGIIQAETLIKHYSLTSN